jgi:hypothetical protein
VPPDPVILLLGICPKEYKSGYNKGTCTVIFIAALFTIAKLWKQSTYPTIDECIKKMYDLYTMEFYSVPKNNGILSFVGKWIQMENCWDCKGPKPEMSCG